VAKLLAALALALAFPAGAAAHLRTGTVAVDYRARIVAAPGGPVSVGVYQSDRALHVSVARGHSLVVYGYLGEPILRVGREGSAAGTGSPTAAATRLTTHGRSAVWHDVRTSNARWTVPISVDGRHSAITGTTTKLPHPALWPWLVLLALSGLAALRMSPAALGTIAAAAGVVAAAAFALDAYASPGTWIESVDEIFFIVAGLGVLRWGPPVARLPSAMWLGLVAVAIGLSKGPIFFHAIVLAVLPASPVRGLTTIAIGAGTAAAVAGCVVYARSERS
jgi:hypothetical protein